MADSTPIDPHVVALDTEALRAGAWPNVNARLQQLAELAQLFGPNLWVLEGALAEVQRNARRNIRETRERFLKAQGVAVQIGLISDATAPDPDRALYEWDARHRKALANLKIRVIAHTTRGSDRCFGMAV